MNDKKAKRVPQKNWTFILFAFFFLELKTKKVPLKAFSRFIAVSDFTFRL